MSLVRLSLASALLVALAGCGGSGGGLGGIIGGLNQVQCDPGTQVQLANPQPYQTSVNPTIGQVVVVANGNGGSLNANPQQWAVYLTNMSTGQETTGGNFSAYSDPSGPHPYGSDFYYNAGIGQLPYGTTWRVQIGEPGAACNPLDVGTFAT